MKKLFILLAVSSLVISEEILTFTNCEQEGRYGPSQEQCDSEYAGTNLEGQVTLSGGIQEWTVPQDAIYTIEVFGAYSGLCVPCEDAAGFSAYDKLRSWQS